MFTIIGIMTGVIIGSIVWMEEVFVMNIQKGKTMSDYIKREDALDIVADNNVHGEITLNMYDKIIDGIYDLPSADVALVRHGEWIHPREYGLNLPEHYCSECRAWEYSDVESNYCPNCGAKMRERKDNG